jgi:hypothetical protein
MSKLPKRFTTYQEKKKAPGGKSSSRGKKILEEKKGRKFKLKGKIDFRC